MSERRTVKVEHAGITGPFWLAGWLFSIGFLKLAFWKAVLALIIWPYYLGVSLVAK
jgi:uncharacterized membrane protein